MRGILSHRLVLSCLLAVPELLHAPPNCSRGSTIVARLDVVDVDLVAALVRLILSELHAHILVLAAVCVGLVDLGCLGQFTIGLETSSLVGAVLEDDVSLLVLVVSEREQDDVALVDPDLLSELASDMCQSLCAVEAERLESSVAQHLHDLCVF